MNEVINLETMVLPGVQQLLPGVQQLIDGIRALPTEMQVEDPPVKHHFADGQYLRETLLPAGSIIVGKKHRYKGINIILKGKVEVHNGNDSPILHIEAPAIFTAEAGVQKVVYVIEETIWLNAHPTGETDIVKIEEQFIIPEKEIQWDGLQ